MTNMMAGRKEWCLSDISKGARSIQEIQQQSNVRSRSVERYNVKHIPLFPLIPLDHFTYFLEFPTTLLTS